MAAELNADKADERIGTAIMLHTMPGDQFNISVKSYYEGENIPEETVEPDDVLSSLFSALTGGMTYGGVPVTDLPDNLNTIQTVLGNPSLANQIADLPVTNADPLAPKAYLNILFFDDKMALIPGASKKIQVAPSTGVPNWQILNGNGNIGTTVLCPNCPSGLVLIYIDNQSIGKTVWFDDLFIGHYNSKVLEENHYYPFGLTLSSIGAGVTPQPYKYQGIELEKHFGLETYETFYRGLDPQLGRFNAIDPKAELDYSLSPYVSMRNNPVLYFDPLGDFSTNVTENKNGTFTVVGGKADGDRNIYVVDNAKDQTKTGMVIGKSLTEHSFLDDDGKAVAGAVIDPGNTSGQSFLNDEIIKSDIGLVEYVDKAKGGEPLDFKERGIDDRPKGTSEIQHRYRGMLFEGVTGFGNQDGAEFTFASARDVGNVAAGYVAGNAGLSWSDSRLGFDALESAQQSAFTSERQPTQQAQRLGFNVGHTNWANAHPFQNAIKQGGFIK